MDAAVFYAGWQVASQAAAVFLGAAVTMVVSLAMTPSQLLDGVAWPFALGLLIVPGRVYVRGRNSRSRNCS